MKKACVVALEDEGDPGPLVTALENQGYSVELIELDADDFRKLRSCDPVDLPEEIKAQLEQADLVLFYLSETLCDEQGFDGIAQCAAGAGADIVGIWPTGSTCGVVPTTIRDLGQSTVGENDTRLPDVIEGEKNIWVLPNGSSAPTSEEARQSKC